MAVVLRQNATSTPLSASATYTGNWEDVASYASVTVASFSDVAGTLYVDFSTDASNADSTLTYDCAASVPEQHRLTVLRQYMRVRYVNNGTNQTSFRLQTIGGQQGALSTPLNLSIGRDADAIVTRGYPEFLEISTGKLTGVGKNNKSGKNSDVDTAISLTNFAVIGEVGSGVTGYTGFPSGSAETIEIVSTSANDASGGTGAETVQILGLDQDWNVALETITLNGITGATGSTTFRRVHSAWVVGSNNGANNGFNDGTLTIRHSSTTANVFLRMLPGTNQTYFSVFTVPAGKRGIITRTEVEVDRSNAATISGSYYIKEENKSARFRRTYSASNSSIHQEKPYGGNVYAAKTDIALVVTACSANNTGVFGQFDIILVDDD